MHNRFQSIDPDEMKSFKKGSIDPYSPRDGDSPPSPGSPKSYDKNDEEHEGGQLSSQEDEKSMDIKSFHSS
jgi:hypothetical protein